MAKSKKTKITAKKSTAKKTAAKKKALPVPKITPPVEKAPEKKEPIKKAEPEKALTDYEKTLKKFADEIINHKPSHLNRKVVRGEYRMTYRIERIRTL